MKNINKLLTFFIFTLPFIWVSCEDDLMETNKGETPLEMTVDSKDVILDITNPNANALNFKWTTGTNYGTNAAISYQFQLALNDTGFEDGITYDLGKNVTSTVYTNESLNNTLSESLGVTPNTEVTIKARVIATVLAEGVQAQITEPQQIKVKTYLPVSKNLYMLGSASPNGWNADNATRMNVISGTAGGFTWQGRLNAGELKFITTPGEFLPSYNKGDDENLLVYRDADNQPDNKFDIPASGMYKITLNIITLAINIEVLDAPEYGELWFVGGFTDWNFRAMKNDMLDPYVFYYNAELTSASSSDEFKIATAASFDSNVVFLRPEINGQGAGTDLTVVKWSEDENANDNKWKIAPGTYKIKLNLNTMKISIVEYTLYPMIYLVGEASPNGWDIGNAVAMDAVGSDSHKFTWTGHLGTGEMKFSCDRSADWNGGFFLSLNDGATPTGNEEQMMYSYPGSNPDNKWVISEAGTYTIELDQLQETVKFTKH